MDGFIFRLSDGDKNVGTVYLPAERSEPLPVLIICHGWGGNRQFYSFTEEVYHRAMEASLAVVTFDFFGCGETGGDYRHMTDGRWAKNLSSICEYVATQEWADARKIGALGISSGSTAVLRCSIEYPSLFAFGISVATCMGHYIRMFNGPGKVLIDNFDALQAGGTVELYDVPFGLDFFKDFIGQAPSYNMHKLTCPIFFLQGEADNPFRRSDAWLGHEIMKKHALPVRYLEIEKGDHNLSNVPQESASAIVSWLRDIEICATG